MFLKQPRISREAQHKLTLNLLLIFFLIFRTWIIVIHFLFFPAFCFQVRNFGPFSPSFLQNKLYKKGKNQNEKMLEKKNKNLEKKKILDRGFHRYPRREIFLVSFCTQNLFSKKKKKIMKKRRRRIWSYLHSGSVYFGLRRYVLLGSWWEWKFWKNRVIGDSVRVWL